MNEKIEKIIVECIKLERIELSYIQIENFLKEIIKDKLNENIEYYIDESGLDGRNIEFNLIDISNKEYIYEIIVNKKKIDDRLNDISTISENDEYNHQKIEFIFELLYEIILACFGYNKAQNIILKNSFEFIESLNETYVEKYFALEKAKELMIEVSSKIKTDINFLLDFLEQIDIAYEFVLKYESKIEILKLKNNMYDMYEKFKKNDEAIDEFLKRIEEIVNVKISNIDSSRKGCESKAILQDMQLEELITYIRQYIQRSFYNHNIDSLEIKTKAKKVYVEIDNEINNIISNNISLDEVSPLISNIITSKKDDLISLEKIDPEQAVYEYLVENYSEIAKVLSSKMDILQFLDKIDNLPKDVEDYLKNEFLSEYKNFIDEIKQVGLLKQEELETKLNEFEEKYTYGIYYRYLNMSKKEKEELISCSDKEIKENIMLFLNTKKELANISSTENIAYSYLFNYLLKREENIFKDNSEITNILKSSLKDTSSLNKYFNSSDVAKAFSMISSYDIEKLYGIQKNIRQSFIKTSQLVQKKYNEDVLKCGICVLDLLNFNEDDDINLFFSATENIKILEELLGIGLYELYNFKDIELNAIKLLYCDGYDLSIEIMLQILKYIDLKYKLIEYNLKHSAALKNIKVKIPDIFGISSVIRKIDKYNNKMLYINRDRKDIQDRKLMSYCQREDMILSKINSVRQKAKI